ncbi:hypothetical protein PNOK_0817000 [Pyrrhoderma noxium]|uniref:ARID domain-containing protein n=1 Tax=Pyrrhoderma noxium TaxID=2282107 RepID=A0A286UAF3_9AGAM|nr:hypothetical protein PNOK_0817000 [Pyrrhoderma noxium]
MRSTPVVNLNHGLDHQTSPEVQNIQEVTQDHTIQLDRALFTALLRIHNQIEPDNMEMQFNGRPIDLFVLYSEVYTLGGITNVQRRDMWAVVIKKMNLDQVGAGIEVDQITKHLKYIYDKYLSQLDLSVASVAMRKTIGGGDGSPPPSAEQDVQNMINRVKDMNLQQILQQYQVLRQDLDNLARLSVEPLHQGGYNEQANQLIETQRPQLTQLQAQQRRAAFTNSQLPMSNVPQPGTSTQSNIPGSAASAAMNAANAFVKSLAHLTPEQQATLNKLPIPTQDLLREATAYLVGLKEQIYISNNLVPVQMPNDRDQFDRDFDLLYMEVQRLSSLLPLYLSVTKEEKVAKAVTMQIDIVKKQRSRLNQQAPSYILNSDLLTRLRQQAAFLYQKITIVCQFVKYRRDIGLM